MSGIRDQLKPLELLDVTKCPTVGLIVDGLSRCSFGGRMLGEVCETVTQWIRDGRQPLLVYDGHLDTPLGRLLAVLGTGKFLGPFTSDTLMGVEARAHWNEPVIAVGHITDRHVHVLYDWEPPVVCINADGQAAPGQIRDGFFPNAVFGDPAYVLPILKAVIDERIDGKPITCLELMDDLRKYPGIGTETEHGFRVMRGMIEDPDCTVFMTLSGAMTIAKMGLVICEMIDRGWVQLISSTGALMAHGLVESIGLKHYKHDPRYCDEELGAEKLNRVTDTLEPEENLDSVEDVISAVLNQYSGHHVISPSIFNRAVGKHLAENFAGQRGILKSAYERGVPVLVPAFVDSEIGNDFYIHNQQRWRDGRMKITIDHELDSKLLIERFTGVTRRGIISIGGGVPRNNTQNVAPLIEIMNVRLGTNLPEVTFATGCRICPDPMWYGHLSGCTYSENASWRKMDPHAVLDGSFAEVHADATMTWPFIVRALIDSGL